MKGEWVKTLKELLGVVAIVFILVALAKAVGVDINFLKMGTTDLALLAAASALVSK